MEQLAKDEAEQEQKREQDTAKELINDCLLYTSDAADE